MTVMYIVMRMVRDAGTSVGWPLRCADPATGLVGVMPVYDSPESARAAYGEDAQLAAIEPGEDEK